MNEKFKKLIEIPNRNIYFIFLKFIISKCKCSNLKTYRQTEGQRPSKFGVDMCQWLRHTANFGQTAPKLCFKREKLAK